MSKNASRVPHYDASSSYSLSDVNPQGNPRGISHVQKYNNEVQESNLRTNRSGHDSIGINLVYGCLPHDDSHPTGMNNMNEVCRIWKIAL